MIVNKAWNNNQALIIVTKSFLNTIAEVKQHQKQINLSLY